ncbi:hypothetical protein GGR53DRAFT_467665 [Hypoxylon sp. FL1150]|nr:hypothetical protein GGR53DRAFT_467665 [Hypoxylon sp. FL1150]
MRANTFSTLALLALGSFSGIATANDRYKLTWYEDAFCSDFLGTTSDTKSSGCQNIGTSVDALSIKFDGNTSRCGFTTYVFAGSDCDGARYPYSNIIDGQCLRVNGGGPWKSWKADANPC